MTSAQLQRPEVESLVRRVVYERLGKPLPAAAAQDAVRPLVVNISARHCHLTPQAVEALFGKGHTLTIDKMLYQEEAGAYAAQETVTLIGPRSRVISNLRILGPPRDLNQVELAFSDAIALGFRIPVRISGDVKGTPGCMLMGPKGFFEMKEGVIRAKRHVHMNPADAARHGVRNGDSMALVVGGECGVRFDNVLVRVHETFRLEVHLDTDEGNACDLKPDTHVELVKM